ncbi:DnaJ protein [Amylostereum chailletii]|nr:DnaJ protein [Amylostereum chailletii]
MSSRLSSSRISSFISFHSCARLPSNSWPRCRQICHLSRSTSLPSANTSTTYFGKRRFHSSRPNLAPKDPYAVLGVKKDASPADIKKVYFSLARKFHPDTNPDKNAQGKFVEIQEAYDILKDEKKRAAYDQYGAASQQPGFDPDAFSRARNPFGGGSGFGGFQNFGGGFSGAGGAGGQADLFEQLFGAFGGRPRGRGPESVRGEDINVSIGLSFMDAAKGTSKTVNVTPVVDCGTCSGTGLKTGAKRTTCSTCGGTGTRTFVIDSGFQMASTCPTCQGVGSTIPRGSSCGGCGGVGKVRERRNTKVDIPAGIEDGMVVRVPKGGDVSMDGKGATGDLLVHVKISPSKTFRRQGPNLYHEARIPLHTALLGGRVRVPTLDGDVDVRVPSGTQHGEEMVLKGRGLPILYRDDKGDLFVTFGVQLPRSLTARQRELLQQYADDVEGRSTGPSKKTRADAPAASTNGDSTSYREAEASVDHDHGTASFHPPSSQSTDDGWLSRAWRRLTGS